MGNVKEIFNDFEQMDLIKNHNHSQQAHCHNCATELIMKQDTKTARILTETHQKEIEELYDEVICPMCYRLNPQHKSMDNGEGCHWCQEKEDWVKSKYGVKE